MALDHSIVLLTLLGAVLTQAPIPNRPPGIRYIPQGGASSCAAPVHLDVYIDLQCPDSKQAFPNVQAVADHYGVNVSLKFILFPLPYHGNAFVAAQGALAAYKNPLKGDTGDQSALKWIGMMFDMQSKWSTSATRELNSDQIKDLISGYAVTIGYDKKIFMNYLSSSSYNWDTRVSWKYACTRGVAGTPYYFMNGVLISAQPSWTVKQWTALIDPLLQDDFYF